MELDLANIKPRFRNRKLRKFRIRFSSTSTLRPSRGKELPTGNDLGGSRGLPLPPLAALQREIIRASGFRAWMTTRRSPSSQAISTPISVSCRTFKISFASPLSNAGLTFYDYYLVDSMQVDGRKTYKIPLVQRSSTPVLDGEVNIDSATCPCVTGPVAMARR